jgi:hypothetical protein
MPFLGIFPEYKIGNLSEHHIYEQVKDEYPLVMLFTGMCSIADTDNLNYIPKLIVNDELEGDNLEMIDIYYEIESDMGQPVRHKDDDIMRYSKRVNKGFIKVKTEEFIITSEFIPSNNKNFNS